MDAIQIDNLTKRYGDKTAVDSLCLGIKQGELLSLLGVNGAGKTTTIKMLSCLVAPTSGDAVVLGHSIKSEPHEVKKIISVSPQETAVAANLTVRENLELLAGIYGIEKAQIKHKADLMIDDFALGEYEKSKAKTLSGGTQRRLSIALALISEPKILFLDEPTLGLDVIARRELWKQITKLKGNVTIILTTHYMEEAEELSDTVAVMAQGKLKAHDTPQELKRLAGTDSFEKAFISIATDEKL